MKICPLSLPATAAADHEEHSARWSRTFRVVHGSHVSASISTPAASSSACRRVAGHQEHAVGRELLAAAGPSTMTAVRRDLDDARIEARLDRSFLDAILDVGLDPVLDRVAERGAAVNDASRARQRETGRAPLRPRSSCRRRSRRAADSTGAALVEVRDVRQILAGDAEPVRDSRRRPIAMMTARGARSGACRRLVLPIVDRERLRRPRADAGHDRLVETISQIERVGHAPIVAERLMPRRLLVRADEAAARRSPAAPAS